MQEHLRYRKQFNVESVRFIVWFILLSGTVLFTTRVIEALAAGDFLIVAPVSVVMTFTLAAFAMFRAGRLELCMLLLLTGSSLTMVAASYVFSFTASLPFWLVQAALLVTAGGVFSRGKLSLAVAATLALVVLSFSFQKTGINLGRVYGPQVSEWLALVAVVMLLGLSGAQSLRFAAMFERTITELAGSSERLSGLLSAQEKSNRELQESEERYRMLVEHTPVALVRYDTQLRILFSNPLLHELCGVSRESRAQLTLEQMLAAEPMQVLRDALTGQEAQYEGAHVNRADGRNWWMSLTCSPLRDERGVVTGAIATLKDDSDRRQRDLELSRTRDLADRASAARNRFLSLMSHEIRTPMNEVYGYAQLLMDPRLSGQRHIALKSNILRSSKALMDLLAEIVDASKLEAGLLRLDERRFEPSILMRQVCDYWRESAAGKRLSLDAVWQGEDPGYLRGDSARLSQMLGNLLANAIQYTPSGFVMVTGEVLRRSDTHCAVKFSVSDSGLGLSPQRQAQLFPTRRGLPEDVTTPGAAPVSQAATEESGLGLAIVRRLALMMDGDVGVFSEPGNGSTFWFIVNLRLDERDPWDDGSDDEQDDDDQAQGTGDVSTASQQREEFAFFGQQGTLTDADGTARTVNSETTGATVKRAVQVAGTGKKTMNILLVEDNPTNAQLVQDMLELEGFTVYHALNGEEALDALYGRKLGVDAVLMDCRMPVMDGYECTQRIRAHEAANPARARLPIIALTANVFDDDRKRCMQVGMDDFLRKPVDLTELVNTLRKYG